MNGGLGSTFNEGSIMSDITQELVDINKKIAKAEMERNIPFLTEHLAENLVFRRASGVVVSRETYLQDLQSPDNHYEFIHCEDIEVLETEEDAAVVSLRMWAKGKRSDKNFNGLYRNTRMFVRRENRWQCVAWFNTPIIAELVG